MKAWGTGSLYRRSGGVWWIQYSYRGKVYRESSRSTVRANASKLLRKRQAEMAQGRLVGHEPERVTFNDLVALIQADYIQKQHRTWERVEHSIKHLRPVFERVPAVEITYDRVSRYITKRIAEHAARGTVHHEIAALSRMLKLAVLAGQLPVKPPLPTLKLDNVRKGFFSDEEVLLVLAQLPDWYAPAIEFAWRTGWRIGEVKGLTWSQVDFKAGTVRLEPGTTKNREGRLFPISASPALRALLRRCFTLSGWHWWLVSVFCVMRKQRKIQTLNGCGALDGKFLTNTLFVFEAFDLMTTRAAVLLNQRLTLGFQIRVVHVRRIGIGSFGRE